MKLNCIRFLILVNIYIWQYITDADKEYFLFGTGFRISKLTSH